LRQKSHPLFDFEAQEHTAQVDAGRRQLLEQRFRYTDKDRKDWADNPAHEAPLERLPVMFCSPTMELGCRHFRTEYRVPAQCPADTCQLRPA
jgi:hypothetical protein